MIMTNSYNNNTVASFKLVTGEELIARVVEDNPTYYVLKKPMSLLNTANGGLGMMPVPIAADQEKSLVLNKTAVALSGYCAEDLASQYMEKTTGLTIVKSM